jgi:hypothetical protein
LGFGLFSPHEGFYKLLFPVINLTLLLTPLAWFPFLLKESYFFTYCLFPGELFIQIVIFEKSYDEFMDKVG